MKELFFWDRDITQVEYLSSILQFCPCPLLGFSAKPSFDPILVFSLLAFFVSFLPKPHHLSFLDLQVSNHEGLFLLGNQEVALWHQAEMPLVLTAD